MSQFVNHFVETLGRNCKLGVFVIGFGLMAYVGNGKLTGKNDLRPLTNELELRVRKRFCPNKLDELESSEQIYEMLDELVEEKGFDQDKLEGGRSALYIRGRVKEIMDDLPSRCRYIARMGSM